MEENKANEVNEAKQKQHEAFLWLLNRKLQIFYRQNELNRMRRDITMKRALEGAQKRRENKS